ncbi:hypothetical protein D0862_02005 [Hortaea werneckii]|uniref:Zn(2)-C6 fungal-type domain-containing protein n=1 Tax=Hortaea werneckii TaxID=91943 RepID=A0A3M7HMP0_HORWE|nr:hypothetical protein D0862_02005 [Hortaea werneckii]
MSVRPIINYNITFGGGAPPSAPQQQQQQQQQPPQPLPPPPNPMYPGYPGYPRYPNQPPMYAQPPPPPHAAAPSYYPTYPGYPAYPPYPPQGYPAAPKPDDPAMTSGSVRTVSHSPDSDVGALAETLAASKPLDSYQTPVPSPKLSRKKKGKAAATDDKPAATPGRSENTGRGAPAPWQVPQSLATSKHADLGVIQREQAAQRTEVGKLQTAATDFRSKNPEKSFKAPEHLQLHRFTQPQHVAGLVTKDRLGRLFLGPDDWETFPVDGSDGEKREWMQQHGFYVCCVECKVLNRDCTHTYPCAECKANGQKCRLVEPGHTEDVCRFGMTCEEPHSDYLDFLDAYLEAPKDFVIHWEFPKYLTRSTAHGCQRNGKPCSLRQMPLKGIALPFSRTNPNGYKTDYPPKWICDEFNPPVYQKKKKEIDAYHQHQSERSVPPKSTAPPPPASNAGGQPVTMSAKETEEMCNTLPVPDHLKKVYDGDTRAWLRADPGAVHAAWRKFKSRRAASNPYGRLTDIGSRLPSKTASPRPELNPQQAAAANRWNSMATGFAAEVQRVSDNYFVDKAAREKMEADFVEEMKAATPSKVSGVADRFLKASAPELFDTDDEENKK